MAAGAAKLVWANSRAKNGSLIVLLAIADEADKGGEVEMSVTELARKTRLSDRAVRDSVKDLERLGELSVTPRRGGASRYALSLTPAESAGPPRQNLPDPPAESAGPAESAPRQNLPDPPEEPQVSGTPAESAGPEISDERSTTPVVSGRRSKPSSETPRPDADRLCEHLASRIEANGCKRPNITRRWKDAARLLIDNDGHTEEQVHAAIDWCQDHEFWRANILSMPKLREKYGQLQLRAKYERDKKANGNGSRAGEKQEMLRRAWQRADERETDDAEGNGSAPGLRPGVLPAAGNGGIHGGSLARPPWAP